MSDTIEYLQNLVHDLKSEVAQLRDQAELDADEIRRLVEEVNNE